MPDSIPVAHAQSLLRLVDLPREEMEQELLNLNLPLVLLNPAAPSGSSISAHDYGRLFIHLVKKLQGQLSADGNLKGALEFSAYRMMFEAMLHSADLEQALQRSSVYFQRMQADGASFYLEPDGDRVRLRFEFADDSERGLMAAENFSMQELNWLPGVTGHLIAIVMWHRVCSWFIGTPIDLSGVELRQAAAGHGRSVREIFAAPVTFSSERDSFTFHQRYLRFPVVQSKAALDVMLETYPAELMCLDPGASSVSQRVRRLLGTDFSGELPSLQDVAERLLMTTPTLHRRLREEGTSFQKIKDSARSEAAINYLLDGQYSTNALAELMGFSDSSTFHRAFKKWTGLTPAEYRDKGSP